MKRNNLYLFFEIALISLFFSCTNKTVEHPIKSGLTGVTIQIDKSIKYQTIEGFGFFGGADVWWSSSTTVWNDAWAEKVISDLGITIWRNELYPLAIPGASQDADWEKQKPVVQGLKSKADKYKVVKVYCHHMESSSRSIRSTTRLAPHYTGRN